MARPSLWLRGCTCPNCGYKPEKENDFSWMEYDYMTFVLPVPPKTLEPEVREESTDPRIEMVGKCKHCSAKFLLSSEPVRKDGEIIKGILRAAK